MLTITYRVNVKLSQKDLVVETYRTFDKLRNVIGRGITPEGRVSAVSSVVVPEK